MCRVLNGVGTLGTFVTMCMLAVEITTNSPRKLACVPTENSFLMIFVSFIAFIFIEKNIYLTVDS